MSNLSFGVPHQIQGSWQYLENPKAPHVPIVSPKIPPKEWLMEVERSPEAI
jgi:hypothetical protein